MFQPSVIKQIVQDNLSPATDISTKEIKIIPVGGGSINQAFRIQHQGQDLFCKVNSAVKFPRLFEKEKQGLELIASKSAIRVPAVRSCFESGDLQILVLEWMDEGQRTKQFWQRFGEQLSVLHRMEGPAFGWEENNYMGSVPQSNSYERSWTEFFINRRLHPLAVSCRDKKLLHDRHLSQLEELYKKLPLVFDENQKPVLVHGDLWSGNFICAKNEIPVLIDPAVYYGHPSVDLAMTTLFGGFSSGFYEAYHYHSPFPLNYQEQWKICNLYPLLIHLLLFGSGYLKEIESTLDHFVSAGT